MSYIKAISKELAGIKPEDYIEPSQEINEGDNEVGELPDELKRIFTLMSKKVIAITTKSNEQIESLIKDGIDFILKGEIKEVDCLIKKFRNEKFEAEKRLEALRNIFWVSVNEEFSLWDKNGIGVRKGFKVVWMDRDSKGDKECKGKKCNICDGKHEGLVIGNFGLGGRDLSDLFEGIK